MNKEVAKLILKKSKIGNIKAFIFLSWCLCLCSCGAFKKDIIKVGEELEEVGQGVEIAAEVVDAAGKAIETVGKEIEETSSKFKDKTLDEHTEKYLEEERKKGQKRVGYKSRTISQKKKELSNNFEKGVNKDKEDFKKRWRQNNAGGKQ
ncbi:MAG: hypothetical protein LBD56_00330 [Endomicrobium sp.]|jgi:chromatin remodeling complex protein RSC6|nr:hypothetical protein [Endomicrobium sp.]